MLQIKEKNQVNSTGTYLHPRCPRSECGAIGIPVTYRSLASFPCLVFYPRADFALRSSVVDCICKSNHTLYLIYLNSIVRKPDWKVQHHFTIFNLYSEIIKKGIRFLYFIYTFYSNIFLWSNMHTYTCILCWKS